jgi:hypothetical protein
VNHAIVIVRLVKVLQLLVKNVILQEIPIQLVLAQMVCGITQESVKIVATFVLYVILQLLTVLTPIVLETELEILVNAQIISMRTV